MSLNGVKRRISLIGACGIVVCAAPAAMNVDRDADKVFQKEVAACMTSPGLAVSYKLVHVATRSASEKATPAEDEQVRKILEEGGRKFEPVRHRTSYLFVLGALRTKPVMRFTIESDGDSESIAATRTCLAELAKSKGMEFEIK